jgi:hypothetical protein
MAVKTIQISANISVETKALLEKYAEVQGVKKAFVIEQALLHHLQALNELPADIVISPCLIVSRTSGERVLERVEKPGLPTRVMGALGRGQASVSGLKAVMGRRVVKQECLGQPPHLRIVDPSRENLIERRLVDGGKNSRHPASRPTPGAGCWPSSSAARIAS